MTTLKDLQNSYYGTIGSIGSNTQSGSITISNSGSVSYGMQSPKLSDEIPAMVFHGYDENSRDVCMTLKPEADISTIELMKINMLVTSFIVGGHNTNPLAYVKKHNLERHFTYS